MSKQSDIREGIQDLMDNCWEQCNPDYPKLITFRPMKFLNELMPFLHSQGVVIKVDRELPKAFVASWFQWNGEDILEDVSTDTQTALDKAGYEAVEPLIEVE